MIEETLCKEAKREQEMGENLAKLFVFMLSFPYCSFESKR